jgi:hypothetical protein
MQQQQMNDISIQEGQQKVEEGKGKLLDQQQARVQSQQIQAKQQQDQATQLDILQRDQAASLTDIGTDMIKAGLVEQGSKLLTVAANAGEKIALGDRAKADASLKQTEDKLKQIDMFTANVENSHSQADWDRNVQRAEQIYGKEAPPFFKNAVWSPEMKEQMKSLGSTWKERNTLELGKQKAAAAEAERASREKLRSIQAEKEKAQTKEIEARTTKIEKNDGVNSASKPNTQLLKSAEAMIKSERPDMSSTERANTAAYVTSQAQAALQKNKALDWETALNQEYGKIKKDIKTESTFWGLGKDVVKFDRPKDKATPAPKGTNFNSGADADIAAQKGLIKKGDRIVVNGVSGTWQ